MATKVRNNTSNNRLDALRKQAEEERVSEFDRAKALREAAAFEAERIELAAQSKYEGAISMLDSMRLRRGAQGGARRPVKTGETAPSGPLTLSILVVLPDDQPFTTKDVEEELKTLPESMRPKKIHRGSVQRALAGLEEHGKIVRVSEPGQRPVTYRVNPEENDDKGEEDLF